MFYSHELLTSRKYGVATVWLVATLGSKSTLKKVTRKAILDVNVPKACDTIVDPSNPLALRLQASLLYGVSRVFSQQCNYVLTDVQTFEEKMRGLKLVMKNLEIDAEVGRTRPHQLNIPEDPAFIPELDMDFNLDVFEILPHAPTSRSSGTPSSHTWASSQTSHEEAEQEPVLEIPSLHTPGGFDAFDLGLGIASSSVGKTGSRLGRIDEPQEPAIVEDPGFEIGEDGSIIAVPEKSDMAGDKTSEEPINDGDADEAAAVPQMGSEGDAGPVQNTPIQSLDLDEPMVFGDDDQLPSIEPAATPGPAEQQRPTQDVTKSSMAAEAQIDRTSSTTTAEAPQRPARQPKQLPVDPRAELPNRQLNAWSRDYLDTMDAKANTRMQQKSLTQARKNAAFWVLGQGIGGVEVDFHDDIEPHPLAVFSGQDLLDALLGQRQSSAGSKRSRSRSGEEDEETEGRRVRARTEEEQQPGPEIGEDVNVMGDEDGIIPQEDDNIEPEVGRQAPSSLPDQSMVLPWNSSSRQVSALHLGSLGSGVRSSVSAGQGGIGYGPPSTLSRRGSRLTSASPLVGRGMPRLPNEEFALAEEEGVAIGSEGMDVDEFELYGPGAAVDTQTAAESQWLQTTLEGEAHNFLEFLHAQIKERGEVRGEDNRATITMDRLLPPATNTAVVGAQALLHVLALTTKGLIEVDQDEAFGDIHMSLVGTSAAESGQVEQGVSG